MLMACLMACPLPSRRPHAYPIPHGAPLQVRVSFDMSITGVRALDLFLSAGLSSHRAHHVLPYQVCGGPPRA